MLKSHMCLPYLKLSWSYVVKCVNRKKTFSLIQHFSGLSDMCQMGVVQYQITLSPPNLKR